MFEGQIQNLRLAIRKKKAKIEEIRLIYSQPPRPGANPGSRRRLIEERLHLEDAVAELETELKRLEFEEADRNFKLDNLNQQLLSAKTNKIAEEMSKRISDGRRRIEFEVAQLGNSAAFPVRWFEFMVQIADERTRMTYEAYRETWIQQNGVITPSFIRAIRDRVLADGFAATKSSVAHDIGIRAWRTGNPANSGVSGRWTRQMDRLVTRWNRDLEAEAIAIRYGTAIHSKQGAVPVSFEESDESYQEEGLEAESETSQKSLSSDENTQTRDKSANPETQRREAIIKKVQNPNTYTVLSVEEAAIYFEVQPRTIHRWNNSGKLSRGGRRGSITISSVLRYERRRSRKRRQL